MTNVLLQQIAAAKEAGAIEDQSKAQTGFKRTITPAGVTTARLVGYVEIGEQEQDDYNGQAKDDAKMVRITFELNGPAYLRDISKEGEAAKIIPTLHTEELKISMNEKAKFFKLFQKMRGDGKETNMAEMLGNGYIVTIKHEKGVKDATKTYAKMYTKVDGWLISPPFETAAATGVRTAVPVPDVMGDVKALIQDMPSVDQWNSIYIDGTYKRTIGGVETDIAKNFVQFKCLGASDFKGSKLEAVLTENNLLAGLLTAAAISNSAYKKATPTTKTVKDNPTETIPTVITPAVDTSPTPTPVDGPVEGPTNPLEALGLTTAPNT